jgi:hypothetical protein
LHNNATTGQGCFSAVNRKTIFFEFKFIWQIEILGSPSWWFIAGDALRLPLERIGEKSGRWQKPDWRRRLKGSGTSLIDTPQQSSDSCLVVGSPGAPGILIAKDNQRRAKWAA